MGQNSLDEQLYRAAWEGRLDAIQPLLKQGAHIEAKVSNSEIQSWATDSTKRTPLIAAAMNGKIDVMQLLLNKGANVEAKDDDNNTALIDAATGSNNLHFHSIIGVGHRTQIGDGCRWR